MFICALELAMLFLGFLALVMGKFDWGLKRPLRGPAVRIAGAVLMLPVPVALVIGVAIRLLGRNHPHPRNSAGLPDVDPVLVLVELFIVLACVGTAAAILFFFARPPARRRRRTRKGARRRAGNDEPEFAEDEEFPEGARTEFTPVSSSGGRWVVGGMVAGLLLLVVLCAGAGVWASILRERGQDGAADAPGPPARRAAPAHRPHQQP